MEEGSGVHDDMKNTTDAKIVRDWKLERTLRVFENIKEIMKSLECLGNKYSSQSSI